MYLAYDQSQKFGDFVKNCFFYCFC